MDELNTNKSKKRSEFCLNVQEVSYVYSLKAGILRDFWWVYQQVAHQSSSNLANLLQGKTVPNYSVS